jgi:uncharacterized membrane protein/protein-disulfide isomerase
MVEPHPVPSAVPRILPLVLAAIGLVVSGVLEWIHITTYLRPSADSFCSINHTFDCSEVALSRLSVFLGVPMPVWGIAGFIALLAAAWHRLRLLWPLAALAALASVGLLLEELLHVGAVCLMCEAVHLVALLLAVVAWRWHRKHGLPATRSTWLAVAGVPAALLVLTAVLVPPYWAPLTWQDDVPHPHGVDENGHHWVGAETPVVTVEEFVDYGCPHCAIATNHTRRRLAAHGDRLRVIRRHQPRMRCNDRNKGCLTLRAAHCAAQQDAFWQMDAWLFAHTPGRGEVDVVEGARALALDEPSFVLCLQDPTTYQWADAEARAAGKLKIHVTPTYRVDGRSLMPPELDALLDARL